MHVAGVLKQTSGLGHGRPNSLSFQEIILGQLFLPRFHHLVYIHIVLKSYLPLLIVQCDLILTIYQLSLMACLCSLDTLELFKGVRGHILLSFFFGLLLLLFLMFNSLVSKYSMLHLFWCININFVLLEQLSFLIKHNFLCLLFRQDICVADDISGVLNDRTWLLGNHFDFLIRGEQVLTC